MTQDFVDELLTACEREGKRCLIVVMELDYSGAVISSTDIEDLDFIDECVEAIATLE
jgi:hypothetical protein